MMSPALSSTMNASDLMSLNLNSQDSAKNSNRNRHSTMIKNRNLMIDVGDTPDENKMIFEAPLSDE